MKHMKYIVFLLICFLLVNINVFAASSKFVPMIDLETEVIDDQIFLIVGYEGENVLALTQEISYEDKYLELDEISELGGFEITKGQIHDNGSFNTIKILADSNKVYNKVKFAILSFNIKDKFKVGSIATVFLYNYDAIGPNKDKFRHTGYELKIKRDSKNEVTFLKNAINDNTKIKYWFIDHIMLFVIIFLVIIGIIIFILLMPSKRKTENRQVEVKKTIKKSGSIAPIKLDADLIAKLGEEEKEVDMSEAIEVSDIKPFGDARGKYEDGPLGKDADINVSADVFAMEASGMKEIDDDEEVDGLETLDTEDSVEKLDSEDAIEKLEIFILILITSSLFIGNIKALEYNVPKLKDNIVNNLKYDKELDYNDDGKIDLADLIETKDIDAIEYDEGLLDQVLDEQVS